MKKLIILAVLSVVLCVTNGLEIIPESTLIWFNGSSPDSYKSWTSEIDTFLQTYKDGNNENRILCSYEDHSSVEGKVCDVDISYLGPCASQPNYNYHNNGLCIFLKLNKIVDWKPVVYNDTNNLPEKMPNHLKQHIKQREQINKKWVNTVWVDCEGKYPADMDHIGTIKYYPQRGFPGYYFPFKNTEGYLSPLVAVHFKAPKRGVVINIECKAWAHNIQHDGVDKQGSVHFELLVD